MRVALIIWLVLAMLSCHEEPEQYEHINIGRPRSKAVPPPPSLSSAIRSRDIEKVKSWISKGADINEYNDMGWTPLIQAVVQSNEAICALLIENGADINLCSIPSDYDPIGGKGPECVSAMYAAASFGKKEMMELLIEAGADFSIPDENGATPLHIASGDDLMFNQLIEYGADPEAKTNLGYKPVDYALRWAIGESDLEDVRFHLSQGATPDICTVYYNQGCVWRIPWRTTPILEILLESGMNPNFVPGALLSPLEAGCNWDELEAVKLLLNYGADATALNERGETALFSFFPFNSSEREGYELVELLIDAGCPVDIVNNNGTTTLSHFSSFLGDGDSKYVSIFKLIQRSIE